MFIKCKVSYNLIAFLLNSRSAKICFDKNFVLTKLFYASKAFLLEYSTFYLSIQNSK